MTGSLAIIAAAAALFAIVGAIGLQEFFTRRRKRRFHTLELVPNILMTRYPIMFVGRRKSLFRMSGDFLELPIYLSEHGFQVEEIEVVSGPDIDRSLEAVLATSRQPVHLIVSKPFSEPAYELAMNGHAHLATLTVLGQYSSRSTRPSRHLIFEKPELRPSMITSSFSSEEKALEHMVSLAEYDLR